MIQFRGLSGYVLSLFLFVSCIAMLATGCGSSTPISITINPEKTALGTGQTIQFTASVTKGSVKWISSAGTIDATGNFAAPSQSGTVKVTATSLQDPSKSASATVNVVAPGQVVATANLQVASYSIAPAANGEVSVQFGIDTNYGLTTWTQPVPTGGGAVSLFVAGMKGTRSII